MCQQCGCIAPLVQQTVNNLSRDCIRLERDHQTVYTVIACEMQETLFDAKKNNKHNII